MNIKFSKNLLMYALRTQLLIVYYFFLTPAYMIFVLFVIFGMHCPIEDSYLHIFSRFVIYFSLWSTLFLSILYNFFSYGKKVQSFIGDSFLQRFFPGPLKGFLALAFFIFTESLLDFANAQSLLSRIEDYNLCAKQLSEAIQEAELMEWGEDFIKRVQEIEKEILEKLPSEFATKGVLTDYSERFVKLFR